MKHTRVSLLALSALAGGVFVASAASSVDMGTNYPIGITFPDPQTLVWVSGLPTLSTNALDSNGDFGYTTTDGSGKISGVAYLTTTNLTGAPPFTSVTMIADVTGTINSSGKPAMPNVKISVKGNGYCQDSAGTTQAMATISYNFTSKGGVTNHSSFVTPPPTNLFLVVLYSDGSTNYTQNFTYAPSTNAASFQTAYKTLTFQVSSNWSTATTSGTNVSQTNYFAIFNTGQFTNGAAINFGTAVFTNVVDTIYVGTNVFSRYIIATNSNGTTVTGILETDIPTLIPTFVTANTSTNTDTNTFTTTIVYTLGETTNIHSGFTNSLSVQLYNPYDPTTSNSWQQVDGTAKGTIKAGKTSVPLNESATLTSQSAYIYTLGAADTNGTVLITAQQLSPAYNISIFTFDSLYGQVVSFGKNIWLSSDSDYTYSGKGTLSVKSSGKGTNAVSSTTYKATLKGVTYYDTGISLSLSGTNGLLVLHTTSITNTASYSNIAASPVISQTLTNSAQPFTVTVNLGPITTTNSVSGTNVIAESTWSAPVLPGFTSNSVPNAILSMDAKGKVYGQSVTVTNGFNDDF